MSAAHQNAIANKRKSTLTIRHVTTYVPRQHSIDPDARTSHLRCQSSRQPNDARLGRRVRRRPNAPLDSKQRAHIDNDAPPRSVGVCFIIRRPIARQPHMVPIRFVSTTSRKRSSLARTKGALYVIPAALTRTSTRRGARSDQNAGEDTSPGTVSVLGGSLEAADDRRDGSRAMRVSV